MRVKSSRGNSSAFSHSGACGRISRSTNERIDSRSASCSSVKGGIVRLSVLVAIRRSTRLLPVGSVPVDLLHLFIDAVCLAVVVDRALAAADEMEVVDDHVAARREVWIK